MGTPYSCDDGNVCTVGAHDGTGGCNQEPVVNGTACNDGDNATARDACQAGVCVGTPYSCDDGNVCTSDVPDGSGGCTNPPVPDGGLCDDDDNSTVTDVCRNGACVGQPIICDDNNVCTRDISDRVLGCVHEPLAFGSLCFTGSERESQSICDGAGLCVRFQIP